MIRDSLLAGGASREQDGRRIELSSICHVTLGGESDQISKFISAILNYISWHPKIEGGDKRTI